jgi:hypothetical protein
VRSVFLIPRFLLSNLYGGSRGTNCSRGLQGFLIGCSSWNATLDQSYSLRLSTGGYFIGHCQQLCSIGPYLPRKKSWQRHTRIKTEPRKRDLQLECFVREHNIRSARKDRRYTDAITLKHSKMLDFGELKEGPYRMLYFFILSCLIFISSVDRGIPSLAAAPFGPATFPLLSARAASISSFS